MQLLLQVDYVLVSRVDLVLQVRDVVVQQILELAQVLLARLDLCDLLELPLPQQLLVLVGAPVQLALALPLAQLGL